MSSQRLNPFLLAADNSPRLLPLLRSSPGLAASQDEHGYSLVHAAASYNHLDLLRSLILEFHVDVNLKDEDGETALFVVETVDCAKLLVEELHADLTIMGEEGNTAGEKVEAEGDFPEVAAYLLSLESRVEMAYTNGVAPLTPSATSNVNGHTFSLPDGISIDISTMPAEDVAGEEVDLEFRRRIEELAARSDFHGAEGQRQLRELVTDALRGGLGDERDVRQRTT